jgi:uncharacterized protein with HEPN domain
MTRDPLAYLEDIRQSLKEIAEFTTDMKFEDFTIDKKTINAVVRSLEVIGEAAKNIPEEFRYRHPYIPWRKMTGMRDKLIHEYFGIDKKILWKTITEEIPDLLPFFEKFFIS